MNITWSLLLGAALLIAAAYCAVRAVASARTPQGAVGWVIFLIVAPWFGVPAYLVFGHHKLRPYTEARRRSREMVTRLTQLARVHPPEPAGRDRLRPFETLVRLPAVGGNDARLLIDGEATFAAIFAAMDRAQSYLLVQFYTIEEDRMGEALAARLVAAAGRGVRVLMLYDGVGSYGLSRRYTERLSEAGVTVLDPRDSRGPTSRLQLNFRNHRKSVVVDGEVGFLGGLNVTRAYMGESPTFGPWRDTHLEVRGPMVAQLQLGFVEDWHWATGEELGDSMVWKTGIESAGMTGLIVPTGPGDRLDTGALFYFSAISMARSRVWIASPYFVPDIDTISALIAAKLRGCDVRILVPDMADHWLPWLAAFSYFDLLRAAGVEIHRYKEGFMHQKVALIDDDLAAVGSANLDNRSFRLNFELMAVLADHGFAAEVERMLEADFARAERLEKRLSEQKLAVRIGAPLARLLSPVL
ncbi:cardiolipin synthase [Roseivivax sp. CAU 1761]